MESPEQQIDSNPTTESKQNWLDFERLADLRTKLAFQTGILAMFALLASVLLGVTNLTTEGAIKQRLDEDLQHSLEEVIPSELYDNDILQDTIKVPSEKYNIAAPETLIYRARKNGEITAASFKFTAPDGYSGAIDMIIGVNRKGEILGLRVLNHKETPGLGDKIELAKSKWVLSFNGFSLDNLAPEKWAVKKDGGQFDQFAGATITPRKSVQATRRALEFFKDQKDTILK